ncbi:class II aldolase/adducin family protein [Hyphomonas beringensis]|uniref:class II aldolase/adducin family protein n=1 Tax=Hyphomonas beringensis TaxID=1280946 RepID=UPI00138DD57C|nr:class II aldolase/adducin family protein [Hyphomonas beringensis]
MGKTYEWARVAREHHRIVLIRFYGQYGVPLNPSSEGGIHAGTLAARLDANAVVHCHLRFATLLACGHKPIPFLHSIVVMSGGSEIPVAPYAIFSTHAQEDNIVITPKGRNACFMAHHGQIAVAGPRYCVGSGTAGRAIIMARWPLAGAWKGKINFPQSGKSNSCYILSGCQRFVSMPELYCLFQCMRARLLRVLCLDFRLSGELLLPKL